MSEWQPIETAPKDGTHIVLFIEGYAVEGWWAHQYLDVYNWRTARLSEHSCGCCGIDNEPPTYWMPLPDPPKDTP